MMNLYELEMQMKDFRTNLDKQISGTRYAQAPLFDWILGAAAVSILFF
ncbi:hypothetical protein [Paenibacillus cremeus]|nr:hypothetical protein [Paenibacillus cremeus]